MFKTRKTRFASAAAILVALGAAGCSAGAGEADMTQQALSCEIEQSTMNGALVLRGVVHAGAAVSGNYRLKVTSAGGGGSANINQGGAFSAGRGDTVRLGTVMLGNRGTTYDVRLEVSAGGHDYQCVERI